MSGSWKPSTRQRIEAASPYGKSKADGRNQNSARERNSPAEPSSTTSMPSRNCLKSASAVAAAIVITLNMETALRKEVPKAGCSMPSPSIPWLATVASSRNESFWKICLLAETFWKTSSRPCVTTMPSLSPTTAIIPRSIF